MNAVTLRASHSVEASGCQGNGCYVRGMVGKEEYLHMFSGMGVEEGWEQV